MRKLAWIPILVLSVFAAAQSPSAKEVMLGRKVFVVLTPPVKEELKLTADQEKKLLSVFEGVLQVEGEKIMVTMTPDTDLDKLEKDAFAVLQDAQRLRLNEIWLQRLGGLALADEETAKKLGLTEGQKKSALEILEKGSEQILDLMHGGPSEDSHKQAQKLRKEVGKKMEALLDDKQKATFETLKGKAFKTKDGA